MSYGYSLDLRIKVVEARKSGATVALIMKMFIRVLNIEHQNLE